MEANKMEAGSQHFGLTEAIAQSLAGRIAILYLLPPSLDELNRFGDPPADLWTSIWKGAYPRIYRAGSASIDSP